MMPVATHCSKIQASAASMFIHVAELKVFRPEKLSFASEIQIAGMKTRGMLVRFPKSQQAVSSVE